MHDGGCTRSGRFTGLRISRGVASGGRVTPSRVRVRRERKRVVREQDTWVSQIRKGVVEVVVLGLLARREMYGSEIVSALAMHPELAITSGTVYPLLARLKKGGLIDSTWQESPVGPPRKYYRLTAVGNRELLGMAEAWSGVSAAVSRVLDGDEQ